LNYFEAHQLLDQHREGIHDYSILQVTTALWLTGDIDFLSEATRSFGNDGKNGWSEGPCLAQSEGTRQTGIFPRN